MTQLTRNFSLYELTKSETALRYDMENTPGAAEAANLTELAGKVLQPIRDHYQKGQVLYLSSSSLEEMK